MLTDTIIKNMEAAFAVFAVFVTFQRIAPFLSLQQHSNLHAVALTECPAALVSIQ
jgi:hypothetical protein